MLLQGSTQTGSWQNQSIGGGTSFATPVVAGFLADVWQKYPTATSNQIIQSLIHNTGIDDHDLTYDESQASGYGFVSLTHMLKVDPTKYPDVNPLVIQDADPTPQQILGESSSSPTPTSKPTAAAADPLTIVLIGAGGLAVVALIVIFVATSRRRSQRQGAES